MTDPLEPIDATGRHPGTQQLARWLTPNPHLAEGLPADVAAAVANLAGELIKVLPDGPELSAGLRKLLEAKDCLVRAALDAAAPPGRSEGPRTALRTAAGPIPARRGAATTPVRRTGPPPVAARPVEAETSVRGLGRR